MSPVFLAETGGDMSRVAPPEALAACAGFVPAVHESAGTGHPAGSRRGSRWLAAAIGQGRALGRPVQGHLLAAQYARPGVATRRQARGRRGRAIDARLGLLDSGPRRALPDIGPHWLSSSKDTARRPARTPRLHRRSRLRRLTPTTARNRDGEFKRVAPGCCRALLHVLLG